jgi:hypothetical protein
MERRGVMAPPVLYESRPLMAYAEPVRPGLMVPAALAEIDHSATIRAFLWLVAAGLGTAELLWLAAPSS